MAVSVERELDGGMAQQLLNDFGIFDGYALCEVLRRDSMTRTVPIVLMTSDQRPTEMDRARDTGTDLVLIKPVSPGVLLNEVRRILRFPTDPPGAPDKRALAGPLGH